jgi:hypothetical protein
VQYIRTRGARDIEHFVVGGQPFLVIANAEVFGIDDVTGTAVENLEASTVMLYNYTEGRWGGKCQLREEGSFISSENFDPCASYMEQYGYSTSSSAVVSNVGAKQIIKTFGAKQIKHFTMYGEDYLVIVNTKKPKEHLCHRPDNGTRWDFNGQVCKNQIGALDNGSPAPKAYLSSESERLACNGRADVSTCESIGCVCRPGSKGSDPDVSNYTEAVLYKYNPDTEYFHDHGHLAIGEGIRHVEKFSAPRCVPATDGEKCYKADQAGCACENAEFLILADSSNATKVLVYNVSKNEWQVLQILAQTGTAASKFFEQDGFSLVVVVSAHDGNMNPAAESSLYWLVNGKLEVRDVFSSYGAKHVELFQDSYDEEYIEAAITRTRTIYRSHFVVSNGGEPSTAGKCVDVTCSGSDCTCNPGATGCVAASCPAMFRWTNETGVIKVQGLEVSNAQSATVFRRHDMLLNQNDFYLAFANDDSNNRFSPVFKHSRILSVVGGLYLDGFEVVRQVYARAARDWAFMEVDNKEMAAVATYSDTGSDTLRYAGAATCALAPGCACEKAGDLCVEGDFVVQEQVGLDNPEFRTYSEVFTLGGWPEYEANVVSTCTNSTTVLQGFAQGGYTSLGDSFLTYKVRLLNDIGASQQSEPIRIRPLALPSEPAITELEYKPNQVFKINWDMPASDGDVGPDERPSIVTSYLVVFFRGNCSDDVMATASMPACLASTPEGSCCRFGEVQRVDARDAESNEVVTFLDIDVLTSQGIQEYQDFEVTVYAVNPIGAGLPAAPAVLTAIVAPGPVTALHAQPDLGPRRVNVSWVTPLDIGLGPGDYMLGLGGVNVYYDVGIYDSVGSEMARAQFCIDGSSCVGSTCLSTCSVGTFVPSGRTSVVLLDYFNKGEKYTFDITTMNSADQSEAVSTSSCAIERSSPPENLAAQVAGGSSVQLSWTAPIDTGAGAANCTEDGLTWFLIQASLNTDFSPLVPLGFERKMLYMVAPDQREVVIGGFEKGNTYFFRIFAENLAGSSLESEPAFVGSIGLSSAPIEVSTSTESSLSVTVSFSKPLDTGTGNQDFNVSQYQVETALSPSFASIVQTQQENSLAITVAGLLRGTMYYFRARAITLAGVGAASAGVLERVVGVSRSPLPPASGSKLVAPTDENELRV